MGCCLSTNYGHALPADSLPGVNDQNTLDPHISEHEMKALKNELVAVRTHLERAPICFASSEALSQLQQQAGQLDQDLEAQRQTTKPLYSKDYRDRLDAIKAHFLKLNQSGNNASFRFDTTIRADDKEESARFFYYRS